LPLRCPVCEKQLRPLRKDGQSTVCPECHSRLVFRTSWKYFAGPTWLTIFLTYGLMFRHDDSRWLIFLGGLLIVLLFAWISIRSQRYEVAETIGQTN
jgi:DNA-directed RNA polymerase subunit RPC12/RpoP